MKKLGGKFNFTTSISFPNGGHYAIVEQRFLGVDVFNYLRMSVTLRGSVPSIPNGSKVEIPDYEEEYHRVAPGNSILLFLFSLLLFLLLLLLFFILSDITVSSIHIFAETGKFRSNGRRVLRFEGSSLEIPFTVEHAVEFDEYPCAKYSNISSSSSNNAGVLKLKVGRNFVTYDAREQIVRYAMTNKISPANGKLKSDGHRGVPRKKMPRTLCKMSGKFRRF